MKQLGLLGLAWICCGTLLWAQPSIKASFKGNSKDFGVVKEQEGTVTHRFEFTNNGNATVQIDSVTASCGCTASSWSTQPITTAALGYVEVSFNPHNRPGPFEKSLTVHFKKSAAKSTLKIKGFVIPRPESVLEEYPVAIGQLRLKSPYLNLGNIPSKRLFSKSFEVYNSSDNILVFSDVMEGPDHITVTFEPYTLKPKSKGKLWVHYDVAAKNDLGYYREDITLFTYEAKYSRKDLIVTATLMDLPQKTGANHAIVHVPQSTQDFGIKQQGDTVRVSYNLENHGEALLEIKKAFASCNCMRVQVDKHAIKPGERAIVRATFLTHQRLGNQQKAITLFTNDPEQPVTVLTLKGLLRGPRD